MNTAQPTGVGIAAMPRGGRRIRCRLSGWMCLVLAGFAALALVFTTRAGGAAFASDPRIDELERRLDAVVEENQRLAQELRGLQNPRGEPGRDDPTGPVSDARRDEPETAGWTWTTDGYSTGYDRGIFIRPDDLEESPFSLRLNHQAMFRYTGFDRDVTDWTDSAGNVTPIVSSSNFEIPRGRIIFSGTALHPQVSYLLNIDYNTVTNSPIGFRAYALSYRLGRELEIHVGQNKVPGTREWLTSSFQVLGADRSLATTFFRPSLSQGIWFTGEPADGLFYYAMLSNGFNTLNVQARALDTNPCVAGSVWWEPWGEFGASYSDIEWHETPAIRIGTSQTIDREQGNQTSGSAPENSLLRLSDGTLITQTGAFAPGVTLQAYSIYLGAMDLAVKYRGLSLLGEFYLLNLFNLVGSGELPVSSTIAYGGCLQGGVFAIPRRFEVYGRGSLVTGDYGTGGEYAGGVNWFPLEGKSNLRVTCDSAWVLRSPADQSRTDYIAGETGLLFRAQITTSF